jgi:exopolyphosphatase/guanosine-5'-triphosphate,3'-diphosphate pyrophosphatase
LADQPLAVIDIGSNSGRMIVVRSPSGHHVETLAEARIPLRLASDVASNGRLSARAIERTLDAFVDFLSQARAAGAVRIVAVATAAVRDATNGTELVRRIQADTGVEVSIIDGAREAALGFLGAVHSLPVDDGMLLDIGGGSIEIGRFESRRLASDWTLPLGALLLSERFFTDDPPPRGERRKLVEHVSRAFADADVAPLTRTERLVGTGGTIRSLARMDRRERNYPLNRIHGYVLSLDRVDELSGLLSSRPLAKRAALSGLNPDRADSIVGGALIVRTIMETLDADEVTVSGKGLREGLALQELTDEISDPAAVREASLDALAARFTSWDPARAAQRAALADELFSSTGRNTEPDAAEMLRHAATILEAGRALDPYNRHELAAAAVLSGDLSGFSHPQLALVAAIVRRADKEDAGLKPFRALLAVYDPVTVSRAATALAVADEIINRLGPGATAVVRTTKSTVTAIGPLQAGRWSELLSARSRVVLHRSFAVRSREDES